MLHSMAESTSLAALLEAARSADPRDRITFRDTIASHGAPAIDAMADWISDPLLGAFAVRVLQRIGAEGLRPEAVVALEQ